MRDIVQWIDTKKVWDELNGWVSSDELKVIIGWTWHQHDLNGGME